MKKAAKLMALIMAFALVAAFLPVSAYAADPEEPGKVPGPENVMWASVMYGPSEMLSWDPIQRDDVKTYHIKVTFEKADGTTASAEYTTYENESYYYCSNFIKEHGEGTYKGEVYAEFDDGTFSESSISDETSLVSLTSHVTVLDKEGNDITSTNSYYAYLNISTGEVYSNRSLY